MSNTIKFYANYKDGKVFISGQNNKKVWFSLWKSTEFNKDLYLENDKFKGGLEIDKQVLRLLDDKPGCRVLVFKDAEEEAKYCISKEEVEKRKTQRKAKKNSTNIFDYVNDIIKELVETNDLKIKENGIIAKLLTPVEELEEIEEQDDLPF